MNWQLSQKERVKLMHISERLSNIKDYVASIYMDNPKEYQKYDLKRIYRIAEKVQEELDSIIY